MSEWIHIYIAGSLSWHFDISLSAALDEDAHQSLFLHQLIINWADILWDDSLTDPIDTVE